MHAQSGTADPSFTGKDQDTVSNLYDFPAREYEIQGRWPSPDPAGLAAANPADPQTWNRYSYVRDSPLNATDPIGQRMRLSPTVDPDSGGGDYADYLTWVREADMAWGEDPGALIANEPLGLAAARNTIGIRGRQARPYFSGEHILCRSLFPSFVVEGDSLSLDPQNSRCSRTCEKSKN